MRILHSASKYLLPVIPFLFSVGVVFTQTVPTPVITGINSFCTGGSTTLSTAAQPGYTYCWQNTSSSTSWQNVGTPGFTGGRSFYQSLAFNNNTPYVAYQDEDYGGKTSVMKFDGTNWVHVGIRGFSSGYSAFQNLSFIGNTPYVAFRDWGSNLNGKCTVMKFDGTNWVNVGNAGFTTGEAGWLAFATNAGVPYVAYQDETNNYKATVMKFDGTNWVNVGNPGFSAGSVNYMSLAFSNNTAYVAYADGSNSSQKTTVMKFDGTNWVNVGNPQFTTGATREQNLAFDGNTPYVAFMEDALNFKTSVMKFDGTNWIYVGSPGFTAGSSAHPSLVINNNTPYIAYQDDANFSKTTVMRFDGTAWVVVGIAGFSSGFANHQSLAFNGNTPYVAFADDTYGYRTTVMKYELGCAGTNNSLQVTTPGTYTVTVTNSTGNSATSSSFIVTEGVIPAVSCPSSMEVCLNLPVFALTGGSPAGGVYSGPGVSNNQFNASSAGTGLKTIIYTYTDPSTGCSNNCSFTINVKAAPTVFCNVGTMFVCLNQAPFILANVTPAGGTFSGTGVSNGMFNAAVAGLGNHTVTYTVTDPSTGCSSSCSFIVNVKPLPVVNCNVGTMYVCQNQAPFVLSNVSPAGGTFSGTGVSNGMFNASVAGIGSHTVTYTYLDQSTGCDNSCSFTVVVRPLPSVSCNNGNMSVCLNQAAFALSIGSPAGGTFSGTGVSNGMFNPVTAGLGSHTITYTYTDQSTSCSNSCSFTITVNNSTAPVITPVSNNIILHLDASGNRTITLADIATVTGGCNSNASVRFSPNTFNCSSVGTQSILVEATDGIFGPPNPSAVMFDQPVATAIDLAGNIYVADRSNFKIRKITPAGIVSTIADGNSNAQGPDGRFSIITDLAVDQNGNLFLTDAGSRKIKKITPAGVVTTFAGSGASAITDGTGTGASFLKLEAIIIDNQGIIYVGDEHTIRKITSSGVVTTIAGSVAGFADGPGTTAKFWNILGLAVTPNGNILVADASNYKVRQVTPSGMVSTVAGSGSGYTNGPAATAQFGSLHAIAADQYGNIYVSDIDNRRIRKISSAGIVSTLAGDGTIGSNDGPGATASFNGITGMSVDGSGNLIAAEVNGQIIRKISASGIVSTLAGNGTRGFQDGNISGITGNYTFLQIDVTIADTTAPSITPVSNNIVINLDASGNRAITAAEIVTVADNCSTPSVRISPSSFNCSNVGIQTIIAEATDGSFPTPSNPTAAAFARPYGIVFDNSGNLFIVDENNHRIRKIDVNGNTSSVAGNGLNGFADGASGSAMFSFPNGIAVDAAGNVYVGDDQNNRIRKITPSGIVSTFAGSGAVGSSDGVGANAEFSAPSGLAFDNSGNLIVADNGNHRIRKITPAGVVTTMATNLFQPFDVAVAPNGDIYVSQYYKVSKISTNGSVTTIAGTDFVTGYQDGPAASALFGVLRAIELDQNGNIYITDNNNRRIRKITTAGMVETIASSGYPGGIAFSPTGNLYFTDHENNKILKLNSDGSTQIIAGGNSGYLNGNVGSAGTGNYTSMQVQVMVKDVTAPVITPVLNNIILNLDATGNKTITAADIATATDNCNPSPLIRINPTSFNCSSIGTQYITVEATDGSFPTTPNPANARFNSPYGLETDATGNIYVSDWENQKIRKISPDGTVSTLAGNGIAGLVNGTGANASFRDPRGVATDAQGNVYVGDVNNHCVRKITPAGVVSIFAGNGTAGYLDGVGTNARFSSPRGLAVDAAGNVYVCDNNNARIRKITPSGVVTTIAGNGVFASVDGTGTNASIYDAVDIDIDNSGNLYFVETSSNKIRKISPAGVVITIAGDGVYGFNNGPAATARFANPVGLTVDNAGNIYVADHNNYMIRMITPAGVVSTLTAVIAPTGIMVGNDGNLYTTDYTQRIRKITLSGTVTIIAGDGTAGSLDGNVGGGGIGNYSTLQVPVTINDITPPVITCPADINVAVSSINPNQTGWATATDNCSVTISYTDATEPSQGCYIIRTWKATDVSGNSSTCIQRIATPGLTVSLGPDMYIMYGALGYVGCRTITPTITGGLAPYTYSWTSNDPAYPSSNASSLSVCHSAELSYTYTVTVTAANGCTGTATVRLTFINISCSNNANNQKVTICHRPDGNPQNCKTICVPVSAVQALINNGSYYGQCLPGCVIPVQARTQASNAAINEEPGGEFEVKVLGNPSSSHFILRVTGNGNDKIRVRVLDALGRLIEVKENIQPGQLFQLGHKYTNGIYIVEVTRGINSKLVKLIKQ